MGNPAETASTIEERIEAINKKLDSLMSFFSIGATPRRNTLELRRWAEKTAARVKDKDRGRPGKK